MNPYEFILLGAFFGMSFTALWKALTMKKKREDAEKMWELIKKQGDYET